MPVQFSNARPVSPQPAWIGPAVRAGVKLAQRIFSFSFKMKPGQSWIRRNALPFTMTVEKPSVITTLADFGFYAFPYLSIEAGIIDFIQPLDNLTVTYTEGIGPDGAPNVIAVFTVPPMWLADP